MKTNKRVKLGEAECNVVVVNVGDREYRITTMSFGQGREIFKPEADVFESNCAMVAACLNNADGGTRTADDIQALPYADGNALILACLDACGLRPAAAGEAKAAQKTDP